MGRTEQIANNGHESLQTRTDAPLVRRRLVGHETSVRHADKLIADRGEHKEQCHHWQAAMQLMTGRRAAIVLYGRLVIVFEAQAKLESTHNLRRV